MHWWPAIVIVDQIIIVIPLLHMIRASWGFGMPILHLPMLICLPWTFRHLKRSAGPQALCENTSGSDSESDWELVSGSESDHDSGDGSNGESDSSVCNSSGSARSQARLVNISLACHQPSLGMQANPSQPLPPAAGPPSAERPAAAGRSI